MASPSSQIVSSSSSANPRTYDAFLSFCGRDTRMGFTDHLYTRLIEKGLIIFRDDEKLEQGEKITESLLRAIRESQYAIVVISKHYAFSKWCLNELFEIVECMKNGRLKILPIFYHVDPSDVRNQKGIFAKAFANHTKATEYDKMLWSTALKEVGGLVGWHIHDRPEAIVVKEICTKILDEMNYDLPNMFSNLFGIENNVKELMSLLCLEDNNVCFIGICGIGGIGKTTLAKVIYNKVSSKFEHSCFINDVRERFGDLLSLQKEILLQIFNDKNIKRWNSPQVEGALTKRLQNKKVLFVLDDVDKEKQLQELVGIDWFGLGSRILVTSRDHSLLDKYKEICVVTNGDNQLLNKCVKIYEVKEMNFNDALKLFSWEAFGKPYPEENYMEISKEIVRYAQYLPLALKVFGSFLFGSTMTAWKNARDRLKKEPSVEVLNKLQISFDGLDECQKRLFLDIACFFKGECIKKASCKLKALGHFLDIDIPILVRKSLIKISKDKKFKMVDVFDMHDLLQEMAYRIVCHEFLNEPNRWSRLWRWKDILYVLKNDIGGDAVESIVVKTPNKAIGIEVNVEALSKMKKLKMLVIIDHHLSNSIGVKWIGDPSKLVLSNDLCVLEWERCPLEFLPINFEPNNLVKLKMINSCIKRLWDANKRFNKLRCIVVKGSRNLLEMPDFETVPNLQHFDGKDTLIRRLPSSTVQMRELHDLRIGGRYPVTISPPISFSCLTSLKSLNLSGCNLVDGVLPDDLVLSSSLEELILHENHFTKISVDISRLSNLRYLGLLNCPELRELPPKLPLSLRVISVDPSSTLYAFYDPVNLLPSSEKWVDGGLCLDAYYFGYNGEYRRTLHLIQKWRDYSPEESLKEAAAWGPTLVSEIPMWFNQRSIDLVDAPGTKAIECRIDLKLDDFISDASVSTSHFQLRTDWPVIEDWGYVLFIVYEALDHDDCQRRKKQKIGEDESSNSRIIPMIVCKLQDNKRGGVPLVFRVPEALNGQHGVWVFMNGHCFYEPWRFLKLSESYSITISGLNVKVKERRGRFFRKDDYSECYEILRSISPLGIDSESLKNAFFRNDSRLLRGRIRKEELIRLLEGRD